VVAAPNCGICDTAEIIPHTYGHGIINENTIYIRTITVNNAKIGSISSGRIRTI